MGNKIKKYKNLSMKSIICLLLLAMVASNQASSKTQQRRMAGGCYLIHDGGETCKNASEASTCTTFSDTYKSGKCKDHGYGVACELRYSIVINYKTQKACTDAKDKALHRRRMLDVGNSQLSCKKKCEAQHKRKSLIDLCRSQHC